MSSPEILLRSERAGYFYCWVISGSMFIYGYSITMLSACNLEYIKTYYHINFSRDIMLSTINGFFGVGGIIACLIVQYFLKITTKRYFAAYSGKAITSLHLGQ